MNATQTEAPTKLTAADPAVARFLTAWHENGREHFVRSYPGLDYDSDAYRKTAKDRRLFVALDDGTSGAFLCDKATRIVYPLKSAYGVPNCARPLGTIEELAAEFERATAENRLTRGR